MENYIPPNLIEEYFECDLSEYLIQWQNFDVPKHLTGIAMQHIRDYKKRENAIKGILNSTLPQRITADSLKQHGVYEKIEGWFKAMREMYNTTAKALESSNH